MPTLRHRLVTLLIPLALSLGLAAVGFGHRGFAATPTQARAFTDAAARMGVAVADLCGSETDDRNSMTASCDACRLVSSMVLPDRAKIARGTLAVALADWPQRPALTIPTPARDRNDPARAPPAA